MEQLIPYLPSAIVVILLITLSVKLRDHPTYSDVEDTYTRKDVCKQIHDKVDSRLSSLEGTSGEIRDVVNRIEVKLGQIEVLIKNNGKK